VVAPGRVNLVGGHTDYSGGSVLPVATNLHTRIDAVSQPERVTVRSLAMDETRTFAAGDHEPTNDWLDYVKGCYAVLGVAGYDPAGFEGVIRGDLPLGAGLSSSASLEVAVLALLDDVNDLGLTRTELARLGQRVENEFVGVPCGVLDQSAVALTREGHALRLDTATLKHEHVPLPAGLRLLVFHTGVERTLSETPYSERRETVTAALDRLGVEASTAVEEGDLDDLPEKERCRLGYVVRENERVLRASDALATGDAETVGDLLLTAHQDLAANFAASCAELDAAVEAAVEAGAYGARVTGAGWGGAIVALVDASEAVDVENELHETYCLQFPDREPRSHLIVPAGRVRVERLQSR
jgi:galactokinase